MAQCASVFTISWFTVIPPFPSRDLQGGRCAAVGASPPPPSGGRLAGPGSPLSTPGFMSANGLRPTSGPPGASAAVPPVVPASGSSLRRRRARGCDTHVVPVTVPRKLGGRTGLPGGARGPTVPSPRLQGLGTRGQFPPSEGDREDTASASSSAGTWGPLRSPPSLRPELGCCPRRQRAEDREWPLQP